MEKYRVEGHRNGMFVIAGKGRLLSNSSMAESLAEVVNLIAGGEVTFDEQAWLNVRNQTIKPGTLI